MQPQCEYFNMHTSPLAVIFHTTENVSLSWRGDGGRGKNSNVSNQLQKRVILAHTYKPTDRDLFVIVLSFITQLYVRNFYQHQVQ